MIRPNESLLSTKERMSISAGASVDVWAAAGRHPPGRSHGAWLDGSWWFDLWRMMMVHSLVYVRPLDVDFLGHGTWPSGRRLGCLQIYSLSGRPWYSPSLSWYLIKCSNTGVSHHMHTWIWYLLS